MNGFEKIVYFFQMEMTEPSAFGWFHWLWIFLTVFALTILFIFRKKADEKQLKMVLLIYGIIALLLEVIKQVMWSFNYDPSTNIVTWDYQWYAAPFQLCTTPIFVCLISSALKKGKFRDGLLSYIAFVTILGSFMTILIPDSCFVSDILVNIHTMWLHCGSFVVSVYLLMSGFVKINKQNLKTALFVFLVFVGLAQIINIGVYNLGILNGETFNMFYISPYFTSTLPVFSTIQENVPFIVFLVTYLLAICLGAIVVYSFAKLIKFIVRKHKKTD